MTILCEPDATAAARLASSLGDGVRIVVSLRAASRALAQRPDADLVVIGEGVRFENALAFAGGLTRHPDSPEVVLVRDRVSPELVNRARDCGVHQVLPSTEYRTLADVRRRTAARRHRPAPVEPPEPGPGGGRAGAVVAVLAAKGGAGKTTVAINLALALNANGSRRVCVLDLDLDSGDVARSLRLEPRRTLADAGAETPLTAELVSSIVTPLGPGLDLVPAPVGPGEAERVSPELVRDLLAALTARYHYVVVDTPSRFPMHTLAVLDVADHQVLLTVPEYPALKSLRLTLDMLDLLGYRRDSRSIVVNRTDASVVLATADVEKQLRSPIAGHIPFSWDVPASINHGVPIVVADPEHAVSTSIRALARDRIRTGGQAPAGSAAPPRPLRGWST